METAGAADVFMLDATFDELVASVAAVPADTEAFAALSAHIDEVQERGYVVQVMQMSMVLGAMACLGHDHMAGLSDRLGRSLRHASHDGCDDEEDEDDG